MCNNYIWPNILNSEYKGKAVRDSESEFLLLTLFNLTSEFNPLSGELLLLGVRQNAETCHEVAANRST